MKAKRCTAILWLVLILGAIQAGAQTYQLRVLNQVASGANFDFDVYILRTGATPIYLGNCDFSLTFNSGNFLNPTAESVTDGLSGFYTFDPQILSGNICKISLLQATFANQTQFNARVTNISNLGNGEYLGTFRITGINNQSGTAGMQWRNIGPNATAVTTLAPTTPWNGTNITNSSGHIDPSDIPLPIQLSSFTATIINQNRVRLNWSTLTETNNYGFEVQESQGNQNGYQTIPNSFVAGHGTTLDPQTYSFIDSSVSAGQWFYRLKQVDLDGTVHFTDGVQVDVLTGVAEKPLPKEFALDQNYPNPFNPSTRIEYAVPNESHVRLDVYNVIGQRVATLVDEVRSAGYYAASFNATNFASGLYFYRMTAGKASFLKKMILMK